ncbi:hypothetical protein [Paenibacillus sp. CMAA1364]
MNLKKSGSALIALILLITILSGCAKGAAGIKVNKDGSIDVSINLEMDARIERMVGKSLDQAIANMKSEVGVEISKKQSDEKTTYQLLKTYASYREIREMATDTNIKPIQIDLNETHKLLYTKYDISAQLQSTEYDSQILQGLQSLNVSQTLSKLIIRQLAFDFSLTLPMDVYGDHNANLQDGNTLTWHISLADPQPIQVQIYAPNVKNIIILAISILIVAILVVVAVVRRRKNTKA